MDIMLFMLHALPLPVSFCSYFLNSFTFLSACAIHYHVRTYFYRGTNWLTFGVALKGRFKCYRHDTAMIMLPIIASIHFCFCSSNSLLFPLFILFLLLFLYFYYHSLFTSTVIFSTLLFTHHSIHSISTISIMLCLLTIIM